MVSDLRTIILDVFSEESDFLLIAWEVGEFVHLQSSLNDGEFLIDYFHAIVIRFLIVEFFQLFFISFCDFVELLSESEVLLIVFVTYFVFIENLENYLGDLLGKLFELFSWQRDLVLND